jgi:hypothetical protein
MSLETPGRSQVWRGIMHHSRLCALLIDCNTPDIDKAASFWAEALGRAIDLDHPGTRGNYRMLETPQDEPIVQIQRVGHESRVHIDIETDDIPPRWPASRRWRARGGSPRALVVMQAPTGQRFCVVRVQRPGFPRMPIAGTEERRGRAAAGRRSPTP